MLVVESMDPNPAPAIVPLAAPLLEDLRHNSEGVTLAVAVPPKRPSAASSGGGGKSLKYMSEIQCGVLRRTGVRVYKIVHSFFGDMHVEVFTATADQHQRMLFRPSDLAIKLGFPATRIGMYLHRRKNKMSGIYQAKSFSYKLSGTSGLKTGSYFISLDVCRRIEKDYFQKQNEEEDLDLHNGGVKQSFEDDEKGILSELVTERLPVPINLVQYAPLIQISSSTELQHMPQHLSYPIMLQDQRHIATPVPQFMPQLSVLPYGTSQVDPRTQIPQSQATPHSVSLSSASTTTSSFSYPIQSLALPQNSASVGRQPVYTSQQYLVPNGSNLDRVLPYQSSSDGSFFYAAPEAKFQPQVFTIFPGTASSSVGANQPEKRNV